MNCGSGKPLTPKANNSFNPAGRRQSKPIFMSSDWQGLTTAFIVLPHFALAAGDPGRDSGRK
jgi:hypothetical protein